MFIKYLEELPTANNKREINWRKKHQSNLLVKPFVFSGCVSDNNDLLSEIDYDFLMPMSNCC